MTKDELLSILDNTRKIKPQSKAIKEELLCLINDSDFPNLTNIWNLAEELNRKEDITIHEMNDIWTALNEMESDGKCWLAGFDH